MQSRAWIAAPCRVFCFSTRLRSRRQSGVRILVFRFRFRSSCRACRRRAVLTSITVVSIQVTLVIGGVSFSFSVLFVQVSNSQSSLQVARSPLYRTCVSSFSGCYSISLRPDDDDHCHDRRISNSSSRWIVPQQQCQTQNIAPPSLLLTNRLSNPSLTNPVKERISSHLYDLLYIHPNKWPSNSSLRFLHDCLSDVHSLRPYLDEYRSDMFFHAKKMIASIENKAIISMNTCS